MREVISSGLVVLREMGPHRNRGLEIHHIQRGDLEWMVEGRSEEVREGMVFFTLPWQTHGSTLGTEPRNEACFLLLRLPGDPKTPRDSFDFPARLGFSRKESRELSRILCRARRHGWPATPLLRTALEALVTDLGRRAALAPAYRAGLLRVILIELARAVAGRPADSGTSRQNCRVANLLAKISERPGERWTLPSMAAACGLRHSRLNQVVRDLTGCTPWEYLMRARVALGRARLAGTDRTITEIALECGFATAQHFSDTFKRWSGVTPTAYRRQRRAGGSGPAALSRQIGWRTLKEERERLAKFRRKGRT